MDWLNWHDLITPTNPIAAIFFGVIISIIVGIWIRIETKETKEALIAILVGVIASLVVVTLLYLIGFYST